MLDLLWPYKRHAGIFAGTQRYAQEQGWESTVDEYADNTLPERKSDSVRYDGIIARATKQLAERAARVNVPIVNTWASSPVRDKLPSVFSDAKASGRLRAEHLLSRGFHHFGALGSEGDVNRNLEANEFRRVIREAGFECTMADVSLAFMDTLANWHKTERSLRNWMDKWQRPIGINIGAENIGRIVVQMCRERGWRVPEDVAIIAGTNEETLCENPRPSLSSVDMGYNQVGYEAARLLDQLMDENEKGKKKQKGTRPEHILLPPKGLVVRESTDFFAVDDPLVAAAMEFIAANSSQQIGADDVAAGINIGIRTLQRQFSEYLGRPISAEIQRVRIERAKRELSQSRRPIKQIARDVGFGQSMRMYKVFVRELGVTPREYRKKRQAEQRT